MTTALLPSQSVAHGFHYEARTVKMRATDAAHRIFPGVARCIPGRGARLAQGLYWCRRSSHGDKHLALRVTEGIHLIVGQQDSTQDRRDSPVGHRSLPSSASPTTGYMSG